MVIKNPIIILYLVLLGALQGSSNLIIGNLTENSTLVHSERIIGISSVNIIWNGDYNITRIEILDQSTHGESGVITLVDGGLNESYISVNIQAVNQPYHINFIINIYGEPWPSNDFIIGSWTDDCVLLHDVLIYNNSGVTTLNFSSDYNITFIQAIDQTNGTGGYVYYYDGGVGFRYVILYFNAKQGDLIHFDIQIYGNAVKPNDFTQGSNTATSYMLHSERVTGRDVQTFIYDGPHDIVRVEAIDQSSGLGGYVYDYYGGVSFRNVILFFRSIDINREINFIVRIYGETLKPRDYISGNLTACSELLHRERYTERETGLGRFDWTGLSTITRIEALDQSIGDGGEVYQTNGGLQNSFVTLHFLAVIPNGVIDFFVNIYGERNCH